MVEERRGNERREQGRDFVSFTPHTQSQPVHDEQSYHLLNINSLIHRFFLNRVDSQQNDY